MSNKDIDYYFGNHITEGGSQPTAGAAIGLDQSPPTEPPRLSVFETFCDRALAKWKSQGILFFTLTIHSKMKYKGKFLIRCVPHIQAKLFKYLVKDVMIAYEKEIKCPTHYYIFFEYTKSGVIHCHGMMYPEDDNVVMAYPFYATALKKIATKHQFMAIGTHCESVKSFADVKKYISKDFGKHPILPIYG